MSELDCGGDCGAQLAPVLAAERSENADPREVELQSGDGAVREVRRYGKRAAAKVGALRILGQGKEELPGDRCPWRTALELPGGRLEQPRFDFDRRYLRTLQRHSGEPRLEQGVGGGAARKEQAARRLKGHLVDSQPHSAGGGIGARDAGGAGYRRVAGFEGLPAGFVPEEDLADRRHRRRNPGAPGAEKGIDDRHAHRVGQVEFEQAAEAARPQERLRRAGAQVADQLELAWRRVGAGEREVAGGRAHPKAHPIPGGRVGDGEIADPVAGEELFHIAGGGEKEPILLEGRFRRREARIAAFAQCGIGPEVFAEEARLTREQPGDRRRGTYGRPHRRGSCDIDEEQHAADRERGLQDAPTSALGGRARREEKERERGQDGPLRDMLRIDPVERRARGEKGEGGEKGERRLAVAAGRVEIAAARPDERGGDRGDEQREDEEQPGENLAREGLAAGGGVGAARRPGENDADGVAMVAGELQEDVLEPGSARPAEEAATEGERAREAGEEEAGVDGEPAQPLAKVDPAGRQVAVDQCDHRGARGEDAGLEAEQVGDGKERAGDDGRAGEAAAERREAEHDEEQDAERRERRKCIRLRAAEEQRQRHQERRDRKRLGAKQSEAPAEDEDGNDSERRAGDSRERHGRRPDLARQGEKERRQAGIVQSMRPDETLEGAPAGDEIDRRSEHFAMVEDVDGESLDRQQGLERSQACESSHHPPPRDTILRRASALWITPVVCVGDRAVGCAGRARQAPGEGRDRREEEHGDEQAGRHGGEARSADAEREQGVAGERDPAGDETATPASGDRPAGGAGDQGRGDSERLDVLAEAEEVGQAGGAPVRSADGGDGESGREGDARRQDEVDEQLTRDPGEYR